MRRIDYAVLASEELDDRHQATRLLEALQEQDWKAAREHNSVATDKDLLLGIALRLTDREGALSFRWVAMRSPHEFFDAPTIVAQGPMPRPPEVAFSLLAERTAPNGKT